MPPGKGVITSGTSSMARTARSQAASTAACDLPSTSRLPPPTAFLVRPVFSSQTNSPSITGMRQNLRPPTRFETCQPSPKNLSDEPSLRLFSPLRPAKQAEPGLVSTHWPTRLRSWVWSLFASMVNSSTATPGRPSSVSSGLSVLLDAGLGAAGDHRGGEAGHGARGDQRPFERGRSDDDPRADHGEGLGESLDDGDAFDVQIGHGRALRPLPHLMQVSGAPLNRWRKWRKRGDEAAPDLQPTVAFSGNFRRKGVRLWACRI